MPSTETVEKSPVRSRKRVLRDPPAASGIRQRDDAVRDMAQARRKANAILDEGTLWLQTPNVRFGGRKPADLVREGRKDVVYMLLDAAKFGMFS